MKSIQLHTDEGWLFLRCEKIEDLFKVQVVNGLPVVDLNGVTYFSGGYIEVTQGNGAIPESDVEYRVVNFTKPELVHKAFNLKYAEDVIQNSWNQAVADLRCCFSDMYVYQRQARRTKSATSDDKVALAVAALGLAGEAGEVAELVKKHLGQGHELDKGAIKKEMGDVLWYLASLCDELEMSLSEVATENVLKLVKRFPNGFEAKRSVNRDE